MLNIYLSKSLKYGIYSLGGAMCSLNGESL